MKKVIVTLRSGSKVAFDVPEEIFVGEPDKKTKKRKTRKLARSCFGEVRLFAGVPKAISEDEYVHGLKVRKDLKGRYDKRKYVESKRVDKRGATEAQIEELAEEEGIGHLSMGQKVEVLRKRKKLPDPKDIPKRKPVPAETAKRKKNGNGDKK